MQHRFLYGVHSFEIALSAQDVARLHHLGHTAHLRVIGQSLKRHELHRELQVLHFLRHYGIHTVVDMSQNEDTHRISQHLRELADEFLEENEEHAFVIEHDVPYEHDDVRAERIRSRLRAIEDMQREGNAIRGYFCGSFVPEIRQSDIVLQAIIQQATSWHDGAYTREM